MNDFPFPIVMDLDTEKIFEFTEILHLVFFIELYFEIVDTGHIFIKDDEIVHPHCDDDSYRLVDIYIGIRV
jgi:hypothetical protein